MDILALVNRSPEGVHQRSLLHDSPGLMAEIDRLVVIGAIKRYWRTGGARLFPADTPEREVRIRDRNGVRRTRRTATQISRDRDALQRLEEVEALLAATVARVAELEALLKP